VSQIGSTRLEEYVRSRCSGWWAVLGSNQWPLPCETGSKGLQINHMRAELPIATSTWYHVMSRDITQCHDPTVPELSQRVTGPAIEARTGAPPATLPLDSPV
jgi:hypothetical protein